MRVEVTEGFAVELGTSRRLTRYWASRRPDRGELTKTSMNLLFLISLLCAFAALALPKLFGLMGRRR